MATYNINGLVFEQTCDKCPEQWVAKTPNGEVCVRMRFGVVAIYYRDDEWELEKGEGYFSSESERKYFLYAGYQFAKAIDSGTPLMIASLYQLELADDENKRRNYAGLPLLKYYYDFSKEG